MISVLVPIYNEEDNIDPFLLRVIPTVTKLGNYEIIFIDDGSTDGSAAKVRMACEKNKSIRLISLTRNFGHQLALSAGYAHATGDAVVSIDVDLQDPPELMTALVAEWKKGAKIVYARRKKREGEGAFKQASAWMFYRIMNALSSVDIPMDVGDYRLIDRVVVDYLRGLPEQARYLRGLVAWSGYRTSYVEFERGARVSGQTHYPLHKMIRLATEGITTFSTKPIKICVYIGFITAFVGFIGIIYAIIGKLFLPGEWVTGWTALFTAIMFFSGVQLLMLGIVGEYIGQIFRQVQGRPLYIIGDTFNMKA